MTKKYAAQIQDVYFLTRIGQSLRSATSDVTRQHLPETIQLLLQRLERVETNPARRQLQERE